MGLPTIVHCHTMGEATMKAQGLALVISGPSGVGKSSIVDGIRKRLGGRFSVSATTRARADGEVDGTHYIYLSEDEFQEMLDRGEFLEHAQVFGKDWYGTPRQPVETALKSGELLILDIDVQGAIQVRSSLPHALMIFVEPPDEAELLRRLEGRGRDEAEAIRRRFEEAQREIELARKTDVYDLIIVNDDLERAIEEACAVIETRRHPDPGT
jgi:guanylate kinase